MSDHPTCKSRWAAHKTDRIKDIRKLWRAYQAGEEDTDEGNIWEYGLSFDYVAPGTFGDQPEGHWRYQLSCGGPSEEFRFYSSGPRYEPYRITFVFLDWFDGYERNLVGRDAELMGELWDWFEEMGSTREEYDKATLDN